MPHSSSAETVMGLVLIGGLFAISGWAIFESASRLDDPDDDRTVYLSQLLGKVKMSGVGTFDVCIYRQSGNVHDQRIVTGSAGDAVQSAVSTFMRAGIDAVHIGKNTPNELSIGRLYHDHRGRAEGKKVGRATIRRID